MGRQRQLTVDGNTEVASGVRDGDSRRGSRPCPAADSSRATAAASSLRLRCVQSVCPHWTSRWCPRHAVNLLTARRTSSTDMLRYTWQWSAYMCKRMPWHATICSSSAVWRTSSSGPSTDPCATPNTNSRLCTTSATDNCVRSVTVRTERIHPRAVFVRPNTTCDTCMSWSTQSKAAERSSKPSNVTSAHQPTWVCRTRRVTSLFRSSACLYDDWWRGMMPFVRAELTGYRSFNDLRHKGQIRHWSKVGDVSRIKTRFLETGCHYRMLLRRWEPVTPALHQRRSVVCT